LAYGHHAGFPSAMQAMLQGHKNLQYAAQQADWIPELEHYGQLK